MPRALLVLGLFGLVVLAACSSSATLSANDYDSSCAVDTDCVVASFGDICNACNPNGAINVRDKSKYDADHAEQQKDCPDVRYVRDPCEDTRRPHEARCASARCVAVEVVQPKDADAGSRDAGAEG